MAGTTSPPTTTQSRQSDHSLEVSECREYFSRSQKEMKKVYFRSDQKFDLCRSRNDPGPEMTRGKFRNGMASIGSWMNTQFLLLHLTTKTAIITMIINININNVTPFT